MTESLVSSANNEISSEPVIVAVSNSDSGIRKTDHRIRFFVSSRCAPKFKTLALVLFSLIVSATEARACPDVVGFPDYNCDGSFRVTFMGDSVAYGVGDSKNRGKGGYALRFARKFPGVIVTNYGKPGLLTFGLNTQLKNIFKTNSFLSQRAVLRNSDVVILDIGRNDRWLFGEPVTTYKNIQLAAKTIRDEVKRLEGSSPLVVIAAMMLPNRGSQGPWVKSLNQLIVSGSTTAAPGNLRFDLVSKRLLSSDQIHPTSVGYDSLAKTLITYSRGLLIRNLRTLRPDADADGIPDLLETTKTHTNPLLADTDSDGVIDGVEVYTAHTDPLVAN